MAFRLVTTTGLRAMRIYRKKRWWVMLFVEPHMYLTALLINTFSIGLLVSCIYVSLNYADYVHHQTIPAAFHSVIGIVLGLLLVFRTNTAYDRWWKAREVFARLDTIIVMSLIHIKNHNTANALVKRDTRTLLMICINILEDCLIKKPSLENRKKFFSQLYRMDREIEPQKFTTDLADIYTSLERIRDTPIPTSYSLHIKVSIYMYFLTMPFGLLYDMGVLSIPLTMLLYYVVAGIEIISNEIENPFYGDPNDLPVKTYLQRMRDEIAAQIV